MKRNYLTEIGFVLTALGGGLEAYVQIAGGSASLNGVAIGLMTLGGSLMAGRISKKLTWLKGK